MALSCFRFVLLVYTPNLIESNYIDAITVCSPSSLCIGRVDRLQRLHVLFPFLHDCLLMTDPLQGHYTIPYRSSLSMQSPLFTISVSRTHPFALTHMGYGHRTRRVGCGGRFSFPAVPTKKVSRHGGFESSATGTSFSKQPSVTKRYDLPAITLF